MRPRPDESGGKPAAWRAWWWAPAGVALGIGVTLALAQTGAGRLVLRETGLKQPAAPYAALSFTDPSALPARLPLGHFSAGVSFTIANASQATSHYQWTIQLVDGTRITLITAGRAIVGGDGTVKENRKVTGSCLSGELKIVISLAAPAESIDYVASCGG